MHVRDDSIYIPSAEEILPLNKPLYMMKCARGPVGVPVWCPTYTDAVRIFGADTFNKRSRYFSENAYFLLKTFPFNGAFIMRMHIPIIGNGDIADGPSAKQAFDRYGVDAIMIGRATFGHPWIFKEIKYYLEHGEAMPGLTVADKVELARRHLALSLEAKGEPRGIYEMRRHLSCYFKGLPDFKEIRMKMVTTMDPEELFSILDYIETNYDIQTCSQDTAPSL